jgi:3-hydroxyisobutyrate dehydrogenase-like beta-hydroxyacid dehydrogenase
METQPNKEMVGVIGLGLVDTALTERLLEHGYRVAVWNQTRAKADQRTVETRNRNECSTCREPAGN